ncbi:RacA protein [Halalkalibacter urbisdiaboli]|uniref:RacA protein n=1 Tax=Halalkalibacter urbisdiaboli TaxID=1960589 RepID=UPI000B435111|nr:RacA protein [Halalkalibacter urbisdiaboli]
MRTFIDVAELSQRLEIDFTTLKQWTNYFGMEWKVNELGHEGLTENQLKTLVSIKSQLQLGKVLDEIDLDEVKANMVDARVYENKLNHVIEQVTDLEQRISQKADEVVSYQLLKQRSELEEMFEKLTRLEQRISKMENKVKQPEQHEMDYNHNELPLAAGEGTKKKRRTLLEIFS